MLSENAIDFYAYISNGMCIFYGNNVVKNTDITCAKYCTNDLKCKGYIRSNTDESSACVFCYGAVASTSSMPRISSDPFHGNQDFLWHKSDADTSCGHYFRNTVVPFPTYDSMNLQFAFRLRFTAQVTHGLMLLLKDVQTTDFAMLYLNQGRITYSFDAGGGIQNLTVSTYVADGQWHELLCAYKRHNGGTLMVDTVSVSKVHIGSQTQINLHGDFFVGGVQESVNFPLLDKMVGS